jgi:preprotein translocase subunit Sss1
MKKAISKSNLILWGAAAAALVGMIIYIVTSVTGYLATSAMNPLPVICTVAAIIIAAVAAVQEEKIPSVPYDILLVGISVLLLISFYYFILGRVSLAADVYFIPVNYPASEATALHISIVGAVFYLIADIILIVTTFTKKKANV